MRLLEFCWNYYLAKCLEEKADWLHRTNELEKKNNLREKKRGGGERKKKKKGKQPLLPSFFTEELLTA